MKLAAFDLEIAKEFASGGRWQDAAPLGVTCAMVELSDGAEAICWKGVPQLSPEECRQVVKELAGLAADGYTIVTWNGCGFDFPVLAQESAALSDCARLAMNHVDLMLIVTFTKGWYLSLEAALKGAGLGGKLKVVKLNDGTTIDNMAGEQAPRLWARGEHEAVLAYLRRDVLQLLDLTRVVQDRRAIRWTSRSGSPASVAVPRLLTVSECLAIPEPDTSWMTKKPPARKEFLEWMEGAMDVD